MLRWINRRRGNPVDRPPKDPKEPKPPKTDPPINWLRDFVIAVGTEVVGRDVEALTPGEQKSMLICLLYKAGALDKTDGTIRPIEKWL